MLIFVITIVATVAAMETDLDDPATNEILYFKERTEGPVGGISISSGAPVSYSEATNSLNTRLINNDFFMDMVIHLTLERIPERLVHAKGAGAFGYFEVTHDISHICKSSFLKKVGKKTPIAIRFSPAVGERGFTNLSKDVRGFAVKFYTDEGNFDLVGFSTPMYFYKDPLQFQGFVRGFRRNPATNLYDPKTMWDIITLIPESLFLFILVFADRGIPASFRNMPGFGVHLFQVENENGDQYFIKFHIMPDAGIKGLSSDEARNISATDHDYLTKDLFRV